MPQGFHAPPPPTKGAHLQREDALPDVLRGDDAARICSLDLLGSARIRSCGCWRLAILDGSRSGGWSGGKAAGGVAAPLLA